MKKIILALTLSISSLASASTLKMQGPSVTPEFAKDALPPCGRASMVIYNGKAFDGTVYLHDTDLTLDSMTVKHVRQLAVDGQIPALCQVNGLPFVTVASR
jgi:hypothetical protein